MKIRNEFPIYDTLQRGVLSSQHIADPLKKYFNLAQHEGTEYAKYVLDGFQNVNERYYVTKPFFEAFTKASHKMGALSAKSVDKARKNSTLVIYENWFAMHETIQEDGKPDVTFFHVFGKYALVGSGFIEVVLHPESGEPHYNGQGFMLSANENPNSHMEFMTLWRDYIATLVFKDECEVDTKIVESSKNSKQEGKKIYNDTDKDIIILDCKWFVELIRTTPFSVTGHFRWQPCGEKKSKKKLIWIEPFEKQGYHRKAKKEEQEVF
jgi:hypothetical protein